MNVAGVQFDIAWENKAQNFAKVREILQAASLPRSSLIVLPEMFATGFSMNAATIAEPYGGETEQFLASLAKDLRCCIVGGAAMRARDGRTRNKALVFSDTGELIGFYAKMRPFSPGKEHDHYTAGERVSVFECGGIRIAPFICYDLRFPELFRSAVAEGRPELFVVIASWPEKRCTHWLPMLQARAIENQAYVVAVNRIGNDPYYSYAGQTVIINPHGQILADAGREEGVIQVQLDLAELQKYRNGLPFLDDLKPVGDFPASDVRR